MKTETMRLLTKNHKRDFAWKVQLTAKIEHDLEDSLNANIKFYGDLHIWTDSMLVQKSEYEKCLERISEIGILICAAVQLGTDMDIDAAKNYIAALQITEDDIIPLANICMDIYGVLSVEKYKEYADRIIAGESMFATA